MLMNVMVIYLALTKIKVK